MVPENRVILCVGSSGSGRDEILQQLNDVVTFYSYRLFDYVVAEALKNNIKLTDLNLLDFYESNPVSIKQFYNQSIDAIQKKINERPGTHIISTALFFEWKGNSYQSLFKDEIRKLNPDLIIIIYDDIYRVRNRISNLPRWQYQQFSLGEIANWRREEINIAYNYSELFTPSIEVHLVAYENGPDFLKDVIWSHGREKIYLSHPITGEGEVFLDRISKFGLDLSDYYVVFDPTINKDWNIVEAWREIINKTINSKTKKPSTFIFSMEYSTGIFTREYLVSDIEAAIKNLRFQVVETDYRLIQNCSFIVVYHPRKNISAGVMCEMIYAKSLGKLVYAYYPYEPSMFFEWYSTRIFTDKNELKLFLIKESRNSLQKSLTSFNE